MGPVESLIAPKVILPLGLWNILCVKFSLFNLDVKLKCIRRTHMQQSCEGDLT